MGRILPVTATAIPDIQRIAYETWPVSYRNMIPPEQIEYMLGLFYSPQSLQEQMEGLGHQFIVLYEAGQPAAFASYSKKTAAGNDHYRLHKLYVSPSCQRKNMGIQLLDHIAAKITLDGPAVLELNVNRNNPAVSFYQRYGFEIKYTEDIDIGNGFFMNDYVMEKNIEPAGDPDQSTA